MASETVTQQEAQDAIASLSNVQGIVTCALKVLDEELTGSPLWEVSEALQAAVKMLSDAYSKLNDRNVFVTVAGVRA